MGLLAFCSGRSEQKADRPSETTQPPAPEHQKMADDGRISLGLNARQKRHQLANMRDHLKAVQEITALLAADDYDAAAEVARLRLGSTTEMRMMCASMGDDNFEKLGAAFHESADRMSEIFKRRDKAQALEALAVTLNHCVRCHAAYRQ